MGSFSLGGDYSSNRSSAREDVWGPQGEALGDMYGQLGNQWGQSQAGNQAMQNQAGWNQNYNQNMMNQGMGGYQGMLGGGAVGNTGDVRNMLMQSMGDMQGGSNMGKMYQSIVGGEGNTYMDPMVDSMKNSAMDNLNRMQSNTGMDAAAAGQGGSSRHAMQNAMQANSMNNDMLNRETMMRGAGYDKDLGMKMDIARQADMGVQNTQSNLMGMLGMADQNVMNSGAYGQGMQNIGTGGMNQQNMANMNPWQQAQAYSESMGDPTVLGSMKSKGKSMGFNTSAQGGN